MIEIVLSLHDNEDHVGEQLRSLQGQTHGDWRLRVRDDGSDDRSAAIVRRFAAQDPRIDFVGGSRDALGPAQSYARLLRDLPAGTRYAMCCDADDRWLPDKIERSLAAMRAAEAEGGGPVLVHTDMIVADADLDVIHPSYWAYHGLSPDEDSLRRLVVRNVVTGHTLLMNAPLLERVRDIPPEAILHDWWIALVAATYGRIVPLREATVLYRQHGRNRVGAHPYRQTLRSTLGKLLETPARMRTFREGLTATAHQAGALLREHGSAPDATLSDEHRAFLREYAELPDCDFVERKLRALRLRRVPGQGMLRDLGVLLRA